MTEPQPPIEQLLARAEDLGVHVTGHVRGVGVVYQLPLGQAAHPEAHALIDQLTARGPEVVDALIHVVAERWAANPDTGP